MHLNIGDKAPSFSLYNTEKEMVSLSDYKGRKLLLLFFPLAFTDVCTAELCQIRDDKAFYNSVESQVLGVSVDSIFTLKKFKEENSYNFPLISDFNKEVSRSYGALYDDFVLGMKGVSKRAAFVIDDLGEIRYSEVLDQATDMPDFSKINSALEKLNDQ